jgi:GT2 family glycosyltransferase
VITIIVPYRDNQTGLNALLRSIENGQKVIVVDDNCEVAPDVSVRPETKVITLTARGYFAGAVNAGIKACKTDVLVLNQDIVLKGNWKTELTKYIKTYALVGDGVFGHPAWPSGYVQGTFMFMRRDALDAVGLLDEVHWPLWGGTCEWQVRAYRKGFQALPIKDCGWFEHARQGNYGSSITKALEDEPGKKQWLIRTPPLVSVVAPCFKHGKYAKDLWESLLAQTFQGFDLTIVDDASPDNSWELLKQLSPGLVKRTDWLYEDDHIGLRVMKLKQNSGTPAAVNAGVRASLGRYVMVMDGDDMLEPVALEHLLKAQEENPGSLIYCNLLQWTDGKSVRDWKFQPYDFEALLEKNFISAGVMFSRDAFNHVGGYPEAFRFGRQDWAFAVKMGMFGHCGVWVKEGLYRYRREGQNRVITNSDESWMNFFRNQMHAEFKDLYGGKRPMGCCGRGGTRVKSVPVNPNAKTKGIPAGPSDMVMLEYVGGNQGRQSYYGPMTEIRYVVGAGRNYLYVDAQDAKGMVALRVHQQQIFKVYRAPVIKAEMPVITKEAEQAAAAIVPPEPVKVKRSRKTVQA